MSEKKPRGGSGASGSSAGAGAASGTPGKRTRTQSLPSKSEPLQGPSIERVRAKPAISRFKPTEIGNASHEELTLTNTSDSPVDFFDFLGRVLVTADGKVRPDGDFAVVGGATTGEPLEPNASTQVTVAFTPQASHPDDLKPRKTTKRAAEFSILDFDGAVAGKIELEGRARSSSDDTVDEGEVGEIKATVRKSGQRQPPPKTFDEMRRHRMAARDLMQTSEREQAAEQGEGTAIGSSEARRP